jgi:hypothetical protein
MEREAAVHGTGGDSAWNERRRAWNGRQQCMEREAAVHRSSAWNGLGECMVPVHTGGNGVMDRVHGSEPNHALPLSQSAMRTGHAARDRKHAKAREGRAMRTLRISSLSRTPRSAPRPAAGVVALSSRTKPSASCARKPAVSAWTGEV